MLPQTSPEEFYNAQNRHDKLRPLMQYLKGRTLPKDARSCLFTEKVWMPEIHILFEQHVCRLTMLDQIQGFLCPEQKRCLAFQTTSSGYRRLWIMGGYCHWLYGPSSSYVFGKLIHSYCGRPLYEVYQNYSLAFNQNCYHHPSVFG